MGLTFQQNVALLSGVLIMMAHSSFSLFGVIGPYFLSKIRNQTSSQTTGFGLLLTITAGFIAQHLGGILSASSTRPKVATFVTVIGISACVYSLGQVNNLPAYILIYVLFGLFCGYGGGAPIALAYTHLPDRKTLACYVILSGVPLGFALLALGLTFTINPENMSPEDGIYPKEVTDNMEDAFMVAAIECLIVGILGAIMLKGKENVKKMEEKESTNGLLIEMHPIGHSEEAVYSGGPTNYERAAEVPEADDNEELKLPTQPPFSAPYAHRKWYRDKQQEKEVIHSLIMGKTSKQVISFLFKKQFHLLVAILWLSYSYILFFLINSKGIVIAILTQNDHLINFLIVAGSISMLVSRFIWGPLYRRYSFSTLAAALNIMLLAVCCLSHLLLKTEIGYLVMLLVVFACATGNNVLFYPQAVSMLGHKLAGKAAWILALGATLGAITQYLVNVLIIQSSGTDGYVYSSIVFAGMLIMAIFYSLTTDFPTYMSRLPTIPEPVQAGSPHKEL